MKQDEEWITGVTPEEGDLAYQHGRGNYPKWPPRLMAMKKGEWAKTKITSTWMAGSVRQANRRLTKAGEGLWTTDLSADHKWLWIQRVK